MSTKHDQYYKDNIMEICGLDIMVICLSNRWQPL